ncbi:Regulator of nonsense transcripts 1 homolog [hydrothermal vent metagenome]|uniref:Regulator of nonsense transcripts 1 homolog n=1 Tax=hydrothermal vent metagenome TaxID=652676 RepID=A0A3B0YBC1_9ZZZZ
MIITNCGRGIHKREIVGVAKLQKLPSQWYAYTNLDLAMAPGKSREIDVIMVVDDRIFLIDLKDWGGVIESQGGRWLHNGRDCGASPVGKIHQNAKDIAFLLGNHLRKQAKGKALRAPWIQGFVVITAKADLRGIAATEASSVITIGKFIKAVVTPGARVKAFGTVSRSFVSNPLTSKDWKHQLSRFFNVQTGIFKPGRRNYGGFIASSDSAVFEHPEKIYSEYEAVDDKTAKALGTLRVWNFTKADTRFQNEEGRAEIAGRERDVIAYIQDRSEECEFAILQPKAEDPDRGVSYWEVYDRRRRMKRLGDFSATEALDLSQNDKIELARQILSKVNALHLVDAAHLDVGAHSVWLEQPSTVRLSHLMAASYPQIESLGEKRYQFLSSATVPEDVLGGGLDPKRKDVFLLGVAIHHLVFNRPPQSESDQMPPEWSPMVDEAGDYEDLYTWFETALALDPSERFADAGAALDAFNEAVETKPSRKEVIEGLEKFQTSIRSQMQLFTELPLIKRLRDDTYTSIWKSEQDGRQLFVKMWKSASWGDQAREGARILGFLTHAQNLRLSPPPNCPIVRDVLWLGDAIVLVQDWIEAPNLEEILNAKPDAWSQSETILGFLKILTERVVALHDLAIAHGDLKPQNILVTTNDDGNCPVFVDVIDFSSIGDGEIRSSAYSPSQGGRYERDRYAVTRIAEELMDRCDFDPQVAENLQNAITICRTNSPINGTLLPFLEALEHALTPTHPEDRILLQLSIRNAKIGPVLADEGLFYLRRAPDRASLFIRGACEEIEIKFNKEGKADYGRLRAVDQKYISMTSKYDFMSILIDIEIIRSDINDFSQLDVIVETSEFTAGWGRSGQAKDKFTEDEDEELISDDFSDSAEDAITEAIYDEAKDVDHPDVAKLWRALIDAEIDLTTEGMATNESTFRREINRHVVPFELESGTFDYHQEDRVLVERFGRNGHWQRIGHLDILRSRPDFVLIDVTRFFPKNSVQIVEEDQRLRFTSHFEKTSLQRRNSAISRILLRQSRIPHLIEVFDPSSNRVPDSNHADINPEMLKASYGLNNAQAKSLSTILGLRPVGLLQGPPGTGKTVFIAALVHYALTHGLAKNVLLASQSHEAVNNVAESVLKLFAKNKEQPSILRVGHEGTVSDRLLPFHTLRVEQLYKDRFRSSMKDRLRIGGRSLGVDRSLIDDISFIEMAIRPVAVKLAELEDSGKPDARKITSLRTTIQSQLAKIRLESNMLDNVPGKDLVDTVINLVNDRLGKSSRVSPDKIARLRGLSGIARDFVGSVSTAQRSFETFLAGTRQIVTGTCVGLGRSSLGLTTTPFDLVIVDEAARCTASELSVPIQAGRWVVLVGDHAQLEPQHKADLVAQVAAEVKTTKREVLRSDFERAIKTPYGTVAGVCLTKQYRMIPAIGRLVSSSFYKNRLEHGRKKLEIDPAAMPNDLDVPLVWVETDSFGDQGFQQSKSESKSLTNPIEADLILRILTQWGDCEMFCQWLEKQTSYARQIGIICTYAAQRDLLRKKLQVTNLSAQFKASIKIDTVDSYQGKENPIVVVSLVRNNADGRQEGGVRTIREGFLYRANRINVAMSRAMDRLVIVGAKRRWPSGGPMADIVKAFDSEVERGEARIAEGVILLDANSAPDEFDSQTQPPFVSKRGEQ